MQHQLAILINEIGNRWVIDKFENRNNIRHLEVDDNNHVIDNVRNLLKYEEFAAMVKDSYSILVVTEYRGRPNFIYVFLKYTINPAQGIAWIKRMQERIERSFPPNLDIKDVIISDIHGNFHKLILGALLAKKIDYQVNDNYMNFINTPSNINFIINGDIYISKRSFETMYGQYNFNEQQRMMRNNYIRTKQNENQKLTEQLKILEDLEDRNRLISAFAKHVYKNDKADNKLHRYIDEGKSIRDMKLKLMIIEKYIKTLKGKYANKVNDYTNELLELITKAFEKRQYKTTIEVLMNLPANYEKTDEVRSKIVRNNTIINRETRELNLYADKSKSMWRVNELLTDMIDKMGNANVILIYGNHDKDDGYTNYNNLNFLFHVIIRRPNYTLYISHSMVSDYRNINWYLDALPINDYVRFNGQPKYYYPYYSDLLAARRKDIDLRDKYNYITYNASLGNGNYTYLIFGHAYSWLFADRIYDEALRHQFHLSYAMVPAFDDLRYFSLFFTQIPYHDLNIQATDTPSSGKYALYGGAKNILTITIAFVLLIVVVILILALCKREEKIYRYRNKDPPIRLSKHYHL